ncbi:MAG: hypothetical protein JNM30_19065 [Rhodospirillales bacterium]|nr:hypothetical protein [Rhodospirillales bacterium]
MAAQDRDDPDDLGGCAGECNYVLRRVDRLDAAGRPVAWEVETCTGCGREIAAHPVASPPVASPGASE